MLFLYLPCTDLFPFPLKVIIYHIYENYLSVKSTLPRPKNIPVCRWFELFAFLNTKKNRSVFNFFCFKGIIMHCHFPRQRKFEFKSGRDRKTDMYTKTTMLICFQNFRIFSLVVERSLDDSYITIFFLLCWTMFLKLIVQYCIQDWREMFYYHSKKITNLR